jgi:hypothetical protein
MELGGRRGIYELMGMEPPVLPGPPPKLMAAKLNIDRTGQTDKARYTGLKMGQILDDNAMGEALQRATEKMKKGERMRPTLEEEEFERPFAGTSVSGWLLGCKEITAWSERTYDIILYDSSGCCMCYCTHGFSFLSFVVVF